MSSDYRDDDTLISIPVLEETREQYDDSTHHDEPIGKPPDYHEKLHRKWIYKRVPPVVAIGLVGAVAALAVLPTAAGLFVALLIVAIATYVSLRYHAQYRLRPLTLPVASGALVVSQAGGKVWPWFLSSSQREIFPLDLYRPETPELTTAERLIFRKCGTLEIKSLASEKSVMTIKDVRNPRHIVDIYEWRLNEMDRRQAAQSRAAERTPELLQSLRESVDRSNELQARTNELLENILTMVTPPMLRVPASEQPTTPKE